MERNKELQEACQKAKLSYMKKLVEEARANFTIWVKSKDDKWKPWGGRAEFPSSDEISELKDWLLDRGYKDVTVIKSGTRPVVGMNESFEDEHVGAEVKELEETPDTPHTPKEFNAATIINNLIQDEWQAIQGYNDAVATFASIGMDENIINIFKDIANEENVHIGQLQKALESVSPNVASIADGEHEGSEQLEVPVEDGAIDKE